MQLVLLWKFCKNYFKVNVVGTKYIVKITVTFCKIMIILIINSQEDFRKISDEEFDIDILFSRIRHIECHEIFKNYYLVLMLRLDYEYFNSLYYSQIILSNMIK